MLEISLHLQPLNILQKEVEESPFGPHRCCTPTDEITESFHNKIKTNPYFIPFSHSTFSIHSKVLGESQSSPFPNDKNIISIKQTTKHWIYTTGSHLTESHSKTGGISQMLH